MFLIQYTQYYVTQSSLNTTALDIITNVKVEFMAEQVYWIAFDCIVKLILNVKHQLHDPCLLALALHTGFPSALDVLFRLNEERNSMYS